MRGSIRTYKGKNGKTFQLVIELGTDPLTGKRRQKKVTVRGTKEEAEKKLRELLRQLDTGTFCDPGKMTVGEYLDYWLNAYCKPNLAPRTYLLYGSIIKNHLKPALGGMPLIKLQPMHIQEYYAQTLDQGRKHGVGARGKALSPTTVLHHHRVLREALKHALRWQMVPRNAADAVEPPKKVKTEMHVLTEDKIGFLLEKVKGSYMYMPVFLAVVTGMRLGEILGLTWDNVDLEVGFVAVTQSLQNVNGKLEFRPPKTPGSRRRVELFPEAIAELKACQLQQKKDRLALGKAWQPYNLVCCYQDGSPINPSSFSSRFRELAHEMKLQVRFHDLRHTHATLLLKLGVNPKVVQERLGHANVLMTLGTYSHVLPDIQREAALKLGDAIFGAGKSGVSKESVTKS